MGKRFLTVTDSFAHQLPWAPIMWLLRFIRHRFNSLGFRKVGFHSRPQLFRRPLLVETLERRITPATLPLVGSLPMAIFSPLPSENHDHAHSNIIILDQDLVSCVPKEELMGSLVVTINHYESPISQLDKAFSELSDIETVRIISHGFDGGLSLGGARFDQSTLENSRTTIARWGNSLVAGADILLYGCSVASSEKGKHFVDSLSATIGADVAASTNPTGANGDLFLEYQRGRVDHSPVAPQSCWNDARVSLPEESGFLYSVNGSNITITAYAGLDTTITIPDSIENKPVTVIGANAFFNQINVTSVTLGKNVKSIEKKAFYNCIGLETVVMNQNETFIYDNAFYNCISLVNVEMSQSVSALEANSFYNCISLAGFTFGKNISKISSKSFYHCVGLEELYFEGNAPALGTDVFKGVPSTTSAYHLANTTGWSATFGGLKTELVRETTSTVQSSASSSLYGEELTFIASISSPLGVPEGTVRFFNGSQYLGSAELDGGQASLSLSLLHAGTASITAEYATNAGYWKSTSSPFNQIIRKSSQTISWSAPQSLSLGTVISGAQLNATVSGIEGGTAPGALTYDVPLGTVLSQGNHQLTVKAAATENYLESTRTVNIWINDFFRDPNPSPGNGFGTVVLTLTNGNVVITAPFDDAGGTNAGAVYLYNGVTGALISSLIGSNGSDQIGSDGLTALTNGNFVVQSPHFDGGKGAVTFANGVTGLTARVTSQNSLVGGFAGDHLGCSDYLITVLKNGS